MKPRVLFIFCFGILLMAACTAPAGSGAPAAQPIEAPPVDEAPPQPTEPPAPTVVPAATEAPLVPTEVPMPFELTSTAFTQGQPVPVKYSCDGENISPPLTWGDPPDGAQSLALIMDDPDAPGGTWDHWIVFNIPADVRELPENMPAGMKFDDVAAAFGKNSWGRSDYGGSCPPGGTHRYFFKLYALDTTLSLDENADKKQILSAMEGHILAETELMGTFTR